MTEPNFSVDFTALLIATELCTVGDLLVFDAALGYWRTATAARRVEAAASAQAVALTTYGGSKVGKVSYQASGTVPAEVSGLSDGYGDRALVRTSAIGRFERIDSYTAGDDVVGYAEPDGRVHLHLGIPWGIIEAIAGGVADDIAKSAGETTDRVRGLRGIPLVGTDEVPPPIGGAWTYDERPGETVGFKPGHPVPAGWFDPRYYGAALDGETDDLWAFQAMLAAIPDDGGHVHMPLGMAWMSDDLVVTKAVFFMGQGGNFNERCGFFFAPGKKLQFDSALVSSDGNTAVRHKVQSLSFRSRILIHPTAHGYAAGRGIPAWTATDPMRVGDCVVKNAGASPTLMFRCTSTGAGHAAVALAGSQPAFNLTLGATTVDAQGITWTTESIPRVRLDTTAYAVGARVFTRNDNRYVFTCTVAGTSAGSPPTGMRGTPPFASGISGTFEGNTGIGQTVVDGTVTWRCGLACAIYANAGFGVIDHCFFENFSGPAISILGGVGMDSRGTTGADNQAVRDVQAYFTGCGIAMGGSDANEWVIDNFNGYGFGTYHPSASAFGVYPYPDGGQGGHGIHDHSDASGMVSALSIQISTGRPILKSGNGNMTCIGCFDEQPVTQKTLFVTAGDAVCIGGNMHVDPLCAHGGCQTIQLNRNYGFGMKEIDSSGAHTIYVTLMQQDGSKFYGFRAPENADNGYYAYSYGYSSPDGTFAFQWGNQPINNVYYLTTPVLGHSGTHPDPGPGWLGFPFGHLLGDPDHTTPIFTGDYLALSTKFLRNGKRVSGDRFRNGSTTRVITSTGWRGVPWTATTEVVSGGVVHMDWGYPATCMEPTTNTGTPAGGEKVFICATVAFTSTTGGSEPNWSTATVVGDTVTDNDVTWRLVGFTPSFADSVIDGTRGNTSLINIADANYTPTPSEFAQHILRFTHSMTADRTITLPAPDAGNGYTKIIQVVANMGVPGAKNFVFDIGSGHTVSSNFSTAECIQLVVTSVGVYSIGVA